MPLDTTHVNIDNSTALGQQTMANSLPVTIASDQITPVMTDQERYSFLGQSFVVSTQSFTSDPGGSGHYGFLSIFNPLASGHTLLMSRLSVSDPVADSLDVFNTLTADTTLAGTATITNTLLGGGQSAVFTAKYGVLTTGYPGSTMQLASHSATTQTEVLLSGQVFTIPPGHGIAYGINIASTATHYWEVQAVITQL